MHNNKHASATQKVVETRTGLGLLVLKNGRSGAVTWTLRILANGEVCGEISGNKPLITLAAKDKLANLRVPFEFSVAIAVERCNAGRASFTAVLTRCDDEPLSVFEAQTILGMATTCDGERVVIELAAASGERGIIFVPVPIIRDSIPHLQEIANNGPGAAAGPTNRHPKTWHTASTLDPPLIYVVFDEDQYALTPRKARHLAAQLIECADEMEFGPPAQSSTLH